MQVWRPYRHFPRDLGTRLMKSRVCRSGMCANSMYMENFSLGRRLTHKFVVLWLFVKFFLQNLGAWHPWLSKSEHSTRVFSMKIVFFFNWPSFLHPKFHCTILPRLHDPVADWISRKDRRLVQHSYSLARSG